MAKYTIRHACGHEEVVQLFGPGSERDRRIAWLEAQECPECRASAARGGRSFEELRDAGDLRVAGWFTPDAFRMSAGDQWREDFRIVRETEKAALIAASYRPGRFSSQPAGEREAWVPKSAFESLTGYLIKAEMTHRGTWAQPSDRYAKLIAFAKENGVKGVRSGMRAATILAKVREAGLEYAYYRIAQKVEKGY